MGTELKIREERPGDAAAIFALTKAAFAPMRFSDGTEPQLVDDLRAAGALSLSLVAEDGADIVGHVAFSKVEIDGAASNWYGLGPISVVPGRQLQGIGSALVRAGLKRLQDLGAGGCVLEGSPDYYGRFGFLSVSDLWNGDGPTRHFQRVVLNGPEREGRVAFHAAFGGE